MNTTQGSFSIIREMLETTRVIRSFDLSAAKQIFKESLSAQKIFFTGEGSSRIFPAKQAISKAMSLGLSRQFYTEGSYQALEWKLDDWLVFGASNSGKTKELILLFEKLRKQGQLTIGITANTATPLEKVASKTFHLSCGKEEATAATKSVVEQALFYDAFVSAIAGKSIERWRNDLETASQKVLSQDIDPDLVKLSARAPRIYFSGRNNGIAEELTLKAIEITRKSAIFFEGTSALHGFEEIMHEDELLVIVDPFEAEEAQFEKKLAHDVGLPVIAISSRKTRFPTISIPDCGEATPYLQLMAGWNFLVHIGLHLGINIDKPKRARKVGNEI